MTKPKINILLMTSIAVFQLLVSTGCERAPVDKPDQVTGTMNADGKEMKSRVFEFQYGAKLTGLPENSRVRVWFPIAQTNGQQTVDWVGSTTPGELQENRDEKYGNQIGYFEIEKSDRPEIEFEMNYNVIRYEADLDESTLELTEQQKTAFLSSNALVPLDGKPQELIEGKEVPNEAVAAGEMLYNVVEQHMTYDKSQPGYGNGDAAWACDSQTGNCTDFHSLFISLARSRKIPARFEIGFPLPVDASEGKIGGYHCWAWFHANKQGWLPVDISEADKHPELKEYYFGKLTADRLALSTGRDIELVPQAQGGPLNYFVYPYVEVDGKPWPKDKIELNFAFRDKQ